MRKLFSKDKFLTNFNIVLFFFYIVSYMIIIEHFEGNKFIFDLKHFILLFNCLMAGFTYYLKKGKDIFKEKFKTKNFYYIIITAIIFVGYSIVKANSVKMAFSPRSLVQTSLFLLPLLYVYLLVKIIEKEKIVKMLKITTLFIVIFYFTESKHSLLSFFDIENWINISLKDSYSFTESHNCAETFLQLFIFFYYLYKYDGKYKKNKSIFKFLLINLIFSIFSFKRLALLYILLLVSTGKFVDYNKEFKFKPYLLLTGIFVLLTIIYVNLLTGSIHVGIDMNKFTTNRVWILGLWKTHNYFSYGYGTSLYVIGRYLEMDLVQIYMELGIICLGLFCFSMLKLAGKKYYTNALMTYVLLNLLTSSTMPWTAGWIILGFNLFILSDDNDSNRIEHMRDKEKKNE